MRVLLATLLICAGCGGPEKTSAPPHDGSWDGSGSLQGYVHAEPAAPAGAITPGAQPGGPQAEPAKDAIGHHTINRGGSCNDLTIEQFEHAGHGVPPASHRREYDRLIGNGTYLETCRVPLKVLVEICAGISAGKAQFVSVSVNPGTTSQADCVAGQIQRMAFPEHPSLALVKAAFQPQ